MKARETERRGETKRKIMTERTRGTEREKERVREGEREEEKHRERDKYAMLKNATASTPPTAHPSPNVKFSKYNSTKTSN